MKRLIPILLFALLLAFAVPVFAASAEADAAEPIRGVIRLCQLALHELPDTPDRLEVFPDALDEILGLLKPDSAAARQIASASFALRDTGEAGAAERLLRGAWRDLSAADLIDPVSAASLPVAAGYHLLPPKDVREFALAFEARVADAPACFIMPCSDAIREQLLGPASYSPTVTLMGDLASASGVQSYRMSHIDGEAVLFFEAVTYYPGFRIRSACRRGDTSALSAEEIQTLEAARAIAQAASGTPLERERFIHDALCDRVSYLASAGSSRGDTAVGALLDGFADCDGYSDAFCLCADQAGLEARYVHGDSLKVETPFDQGEDAEEDNQSGTHMWNMVCLDGVWVFLDITWDDQDPGIAYSNYNIGASRCALEHDWDRRTMTVEPAVGMQNALRGADIQLDRLASWEDLYAICRSRTQSRPDRLSLFCPVALDLSACGERLSEALYSLGATGFTWHMSNAIVEVSGLRYVPEYHVCESEAEAAAYIEYCANANLADFTVYFTPELSPLMFADNRARLDALVGASRLRRTEYSYNEGERRLVISNAGYYDPGFAASSMQEAVARLRETLKARPDGACVILPAGLPFESVSQALSDAIHAMGVSRYLYVLCGPRVTLTDIEYEPEFALAPDEQAVISYLSHCRANGIADFRLYCDSDLYATLTQDDFTLFFDLLDQCGCEIDGCSYIDDYCALIVSGATWR